MSTQVNLEKQVITIGKYELLRMTVKRDKNNIRLWVKSPYFEEFFKTFGLTDSLKIKGNRLYNMPDIDPHYNTMFKFKKQLQLMIDESPDLQILRFEGLSDGIFISYDELISNDKLEEFYTGFKLSVENFFNEYLKPVTNELIIKVSKK